MSETARKIPKNGLIVPTFEEKLVLERAIRLGFLSRSGHIAPPKLPYSYSSYPGRGLCGYRPRFSRENPWEKTVPHRVCYHCLESIPGTIEYFMCNIRLKFCGNVGLETSYRQLFSHDGKKDLILSVSKSKLIEMGLNPWKAYDPYYLVKTIGKAKVLELYNGDTE